MKHEEFIGEKVSRRGYVACFTNAACLGQVGIAAAVRCYGTFGSGDKIITQEDTQVGASDSGLAVTQGAAGREGAQAISASGLLSTVKYGSTEVANSNLLTSSLQNSTNTGTINFGLQPAEFKGILESVTGNLSESIGKQTESSLEALAGLAETKVTDGENKKTSAGLIVAVVALAAVAWVLGKIFGRNK